MKELWYEKSANVVVPEGQRQNVDTVWEPADNVCSLDDSYGMPLLRRNAAGCA